ncbi:hypothetical protein BpHYR1_007737 [Brachionus plicatilis]|uniref:Uncharacterized protein n=1 Tax=Brachionus plicatilis TaxID=10195 RepID=A0A3M7REH9_BRAPC|nr:hypothetical protein BpHYR1_007737 [Brachionus plicatilis]
MESRLYTVTDYRQTRPSQPNISFTAVLIQLVANLKEDASLNHELGIKYKISNSIRLNFIKKGFLYPKKCNEKF